MCIFFLPSECLFGPIPSGTGDSTPSSLSSRSSTSTIGSKGSSEASAETFPSFLSSSTLSSTTELAQTSTVETKHSQAISALFDLLHTGRGVEIGRCVDATSPAPKQCTKIQIRHRSSRKVASGFFDKCHICTVHARVWQSGRDEEKVTWEQVEEARDRVQNIKKAKTGMCGAEGCDECKPQQT